MSAISFAPHVIVESEANGASSVYATDLDGDGDIDVLSTSSDRVTWYENADGERSFGPQQVITSLTLGFDDTGYGFTGGFLWKVNDQWSIGGNYRGGPEFDYGGSSEIGPAFPFDTVPEGLVGEFCCVSAELPDVYSLGVSFRPLESFILAFEWDRIEYSVSLESIGVDNLFIDDADELRLGAEYVFARSNPLVALRGGVWLDPDHATRAGEDADEIVSALLPGSDDEVHYSLGIGLAFKRFQIDAAVDLSERVDTFSISGIFGF